MTISDYIKTMADLLGCKFEIFGKPISSDKVFAEDGLLPAFTKRAESLSTFVLNKTLGVTYQKVSGSVSGLKVSFDESVPNSYRILCMLDVLIELIHQSSSAKNIKLDELLYD
jgi:intracellular multiplication protein IcmS